MPPRATSQRNHGLAALSALLVMALALPAFGQTQARPPRDRKDETGVDAGAAVGTVLDIARRAEEARRKREEERREARERERQAAEQARLDQAAEQARIDAAARAEAQAAQARDAAARAEAARIDASRVEAARVRADAERRARDLAGRPAAKPRNASRPEPRPQPAPPPAPKPAPPLAAPEPVPAPTASLPARPPSPVTAPRRSETSPLRLPFMLLGIAIALLIGGIAVSRVVIAVFGPKPRAVAKVDPGQVSAPDFGATDADLPAPTARAIAGDFTSEIDYPAPAAETP